MTITIKDEIINREQIIKLYPVAIIETGEENETTHISIEWIDTEGVGKVIVVGYAIVINFDNSSTKEFFYPTRDEFNNAIIDIQKQLSKN
jgi:hypothetical protein